MWRTLAPSGEQGCHESQCRSAGVGGFVRLPEGWASGSSPDFKWGKVVRLTYVGLAFCGSLLRLCRTTFGLQHDVIAPGVFQTARHGQRTENRATQQPRHRFVALLPPVGSPSPVSQTMRLRCSPRLPQTVQRRFPDNAPSVEKLPKRQRFGPFTT